MNISLPGHPVFNTNAVSVSKPHPEALLVQSVSESGARVYAAVHGWATHCSSRFCGRLPRRQRSLAGPARTVAARGREAEGDAEAETAEIGVVWGNDSEAGVALHAQTVQGVAYVK